MVKPQQILKLLVTDEDIDYALELALSNQFLDNLRSRPIAVQLDCKVRGYIGEIALKRWFATHDIVFAESNFKPDGEMMDIDFLYQKANRSIKIEVKTSLLPDKYTTIGDAIQVCDIKLIQRKQQPIVELSGDVHLQIYFNFYRKKRDEYLSSLTLENQEKEYLKTMLKLNRYKEATYFAAWIDKESLQTHILGLPETQRLWSFKGSMRQFWTCNIAKTAKPAAELPDFLKN